MRLVTSPASEAVGLFLTKSAATTTLCQLKRQPPPGGLGAAAGIPLWLSASNQAQKGPWPSGPGAGVPMAKGFR